MTWPGNISNFSNLITLKTSQVVTYLDKADLIFKTPLRSLHNKGDFPNGTLHTSFIMLDKGERAGWTEL